MINKALFGLLTVLLLISQSTSFKVAQLQQNLFKKNNNNLPIKSDHNSCGKTFTDLIIKTIEDATVFYGADVWKNIDYIKTKLYSSAKVHIDVTIFTNVKSSNQYYSGWLDQILCDYLAFNPNKYQDGWAYLIKGDHSSHYFTATLETSTKGPKLSTKVYQAIENIIKLVVKEHPDSLMDQTRFIGDKIKEYNKQVWEMYVATGDVKGFIRTYNAYDGEWMIYVEPTTQNKYVLKRF